MTMHLTWTLTGVVDDIYRPGAITASADERLEEIAADLQRRTSARWSSWPATVWLGSSPSATSSARWPTGASWLGILRRQATVTSEGMEALLAWTNGEPGAADRLRECEHRADQVKRELR